MVFASHSVIGHPYPVGPSPEGIPNSVTGGAGGIGLPHPVGRSPESIPDSVTGGSGGIGLPDSVGRGPESIPDSVTRDVGKLAAEAADPNAQATALTQVLADIVGPKLAPDLTKLILALAKSGFLPSIINSNLIKLLPSIRKNLPKIIGPLSNILANAAASAS